MELRFNFSANFRSAANISIISKLAVGKDFLLILHGTAAKLFEENRNLRWSNLRKFQKISKSRSVLTGSYLSFSRHNLIFHFTKIFISKNDESNHKEDNFPLFLSTLLGNLFLW